MLCAWQIQSGSNAIRGALERGAAVDAVVAICAIFSLVAMVCGDAHYLNAENEVQIKHEMLPNTKLAKSLARFAVVVPFQFFVYPCK